MFGLKMGELLIIFLVILVLYMLVNLIVDLLYAYVDPRIDLA